MALPPIVRRLLIPWRIYIVLLTPLFVSPLLFSPKAAYRCGFVIIIMVVYWISEAIPLAVTSLLPVVLYPALGIMTTSETSIHYLKDTNMMFLGGLWAAIAVEYSRLHYRIALKVILIVGTTPIRLLVGLMITTMFMSMWISNSAATALMMPIVGAMVSELKQSRAESAKDAEGADAANKPDEKKESGERERPTKETIGFYVGVAYSANIGGTGTLVGTGTNLSFVGIFNSLYPQSQDLNFLSWLYFGVPYMLISTLIIIIYLLVFYMGMGRTKTADQQINIANAVKVRGLIKERYAALGPMSFHEIMVMTWFSILIVLWVTRNPVMFPGWADLFYTETTPIKDASPVILIIIMLFLVPSNLKFLNRNEPYEKPTPAVLDWKFVQENTSWGLMIFLGGSFAMAVGMKESKLSDTLGHALSVLNVMSTPVIMIVTAILTVAFSQISSNIASANIALPVVADMAVKMHVNPLYLMIPVAVAASLAFMLPVSTPPNAMIMEAGNLRTMDLVATGAPAVILLLALLFGFFITYGVYIYDLNTFPCWAETNPTTNTMGNC